MASMTLTAMAASLLAAAASGAPLRAPPLAAGAVGDDRIEWSWEAVPGATGYRVYPDPGAGPIAVAGLSFLQTGLAPDATARILVSAVDGTSEGPLSAPPAPLRTLARSASGLVAAETRLNGVSLEWFLNGNPPDALATVERSSDGESFRLAAEVADWRWAADDLAFCATYYYRVRYRNAEQVLSIPAAPLRVRTLSPPAPAVPFFMATALDGGLIRFNWGSPGVPELAGYRLYWDQGDGTSPSELLAELPRSSVTATLGPFVSSAAYRFGLRAHSTCGLEQAAPGFEASAPAVRSLLGARARVSDPPPGARVDGPRVLVAAEFLSGDADQTREVRFEKRAAGSRWWTPLAPAGAGQANPDASRPFLLHWDASAEAPGDYELRAVAVENSGRADAAPAATPVRVARLAPTCRGPDAGAASASFDADRTARARASLEDGSYGALLALPGAAHPAGELSLRLLAGAGVAAAGGDGPVGPAVEVALPVSGFGVGLAPAPARLTLFYPDADGRGIVDGTELRADRLRVARRELDGGWTPVASARDAPARSLAAPITTAGSYALVAAAAGSDAEAARAYPNPYRPGVDPPSGVLFDRLPDQATVEIFDLSGRSLRRLAPTAGATSASWDGKDASGRDAAAGVYLAVIRGPDGRRATRKVLVVR